MAVTIASIIVGCMLALLSLSALILNLLVAIAIVHANMMKSVAPDYILPFPDFLFPEDYVEMGRKIMDVLLMICWYFGTLSHILIAINRFFTVVFYRYAIFTRRRVVYITLLQALGCIGLAAMTQFIFPCCRLTFTYFVYTYTYLEIPGVPNYSNMFDLPLNSLATLTPLIAYSTIAIVVSRASGNVGRSRRREYIFAIQFAAMALMYTLVWLSVRAMPLILSGTDKLYLYGITTCLTLCNTSTNAVVYLTNNGEIKRSLRSLRSTFRPSSTVPRQSGTVDRTRTPSTMK